MQRLPATIGLDIGASKAHIGIVDETGRVLRSARITTGFGCDASALAQRAISAANTCLQESGLSWEDIRFLGVGVPGTVHGGIVRYAPNLDWRDVPILDALRLHCAAPMGLVQDTHAGALGEYYAGAGMGAGDMACVSMGTGVGCGLVLNGRLFTGTLGTAGEIGHILIDPGGPVCNCGQRGCMEAYASGRALNKAAKELGLADSYALFARASAGDEACYAAVRRGADAVGTAIVAITNLLSVGAVILSGGLCKQVLYVDLIRAFVLKHGYQVAVRHPRFTLCTALLGENAPLVGAAMLYRMIEPSQSLSH